MSNTRISPPRKTKSHVSLGHFTYFMVISLVVVLRDANLSVIHKSHFLWGRFIERKMSCIKGMTTTCRKCAICDKREPHAASCFKTVPITWTEMERLSMNALAECRGKEPSSFPTIGLSEISGAGPSCERIEFFSIENPGEGGLAP